MLETELYSHLTSDTQLSAVLSDRIYPQVAPMGVSTPFAVYTVVDERDMQPADRDVCMEKFWFQIDIYADDYKTAKETKAVLKEALYRFHTYPKNLASRDVYEKDTELFRQLVEFRMKK